MSVSGGGGQIRYALLLDSAPAERALTTFKSSLTQLGTGTTSVSRQVQGFTASLSKQSTAFTAGINPIKQQGTALTNLTTHLKTHTTQLTGVGTKIKDTASKFAGFATGLSATATGVLQLSAGFRDYGDAQIAVDKAQRKLSLSQEALNKATDKLNALTKKGVTSGKEYQQAQLDVKQAQDGLAISTQLVGERQEDMFDAQTRFATSVIPVTLGAVGTLGSAYKELGLNSGKLTGIFSKLGGSFSGIIPSLTGIATKAPLAATSLVGVGAASTASAAGVTGLKGALSGLALGLGAVVGIPLAGIFAAGALQKMLHFEELANKNTAGQLAWLKVLGLTDAQIKGILPSLKSFNDIFGLTTPTVKDVDAALHPVIKTLSTIPPSMNAAATSTDAWVNMMIKALQSADPKKIIEFNAAFEASGQSQERYKQILTEADAILAKYNVTTDLSSKSAGKLSAATTILAKDIGVVTTVAVKSTEGFSKLGQAFALDWVQISKLQGITDSFGASLPTLITRFKELAAARKEIPNWLTPDMQLWNKWASDPNPSAVLHSNAISILDVKSAMTGWDSVIRKNTVSAVDNAKAIAEQTKKVQEFQARIAEGVKAVSVTFGVKDNTEKFMKDIMKNLDKGIRKKVDVKLDFRGDKAAALTSFNNFIKTATTMDEKTADGIVKGIIETIDEKFKGTKGSFAGLRAQLETEMKNPNTVAVLNQTLMNGDYTAAGNKIGTSVGTAATTAFKGAFAGLGLADWASFDNAIVIPAPTIPKPITTEFDAGIKAAITSVGNISNTIPTISVINSKALKAIGVIAQHIQDLDKLKPVAQVVNSKALKAVGVIANHIDDLAKIKPTLQVNNNKALQAVGVIAKNIMKLESLNPTIKVGISGPGVKFAQSGMHETLDRDTVIMAHKDERVDIGHGGSRIGRSMMASSSGGGSGGGNNYFELHTHIGDQDIIRKFTAAQGKNRWRLG